MNQARQQEPDFFEKRKQYTNLVYWIAQIHQRGIILPFRKRCGTQALAMPCFFALLLMFFWYLFTADPGMLAWTAFWFLCFVVRRIEAIRISGQVPSLYDGQTKNLGSNEKLAKLIYEPFLMGVLGILVLKFYEHNGVPPTGLPYFLLLGVFTLPFVAIVDQTIWNKRIQSMRDAELENEWAIRDYRNKFGD